MTQEEAWARFTQASVDMCGRKNKLTGNDRYRVFYSQGINYYRVKTRNDLFIIKTIIDRTHGWDNSIRDIQIVAQAGKFNEDRTWASVLHAINRIQPFIMMRESARPSWISLNAPLSETEIILLLQEEPFTGYEEDGPVFLLKGLL